jgi:hypothetical protein
MQWKEAISPEARNINSPHCKKSKLHLFLLQLENLFPLLVAASKCHTEMTSALKAWNALWTSISNSVRLPPSASHLSRTDDVAAAISGIQAYKPTIRTYWAATSRAAKRRAEMRATIATRRR